MKKPEQNGYKGKPSRGEFGYVADGLSKNKGELNFFQIFPRASYHYWAALWNASKKMIYK